MNVLAWVCEAIVAAQVVASLTVGGLVLRRWRRLRRLVRPGYVDVSGIPMRPRD